jgi:hypothetical protein
MNSLRLMCAVGSLSLVAACLDDGTCRSIGGSNGDNTCEVSALCDTNEDGAVESGVDESFVYNCDDTGTCTCANEAQTQFANGCEGTGATHFLLLKNECGFEVVLNQSFCQDLGGTAEECDELVR